MGNASTKDDSPPVEQLGGIVAPESWDTDPGRFKQISPMSDISAPSKFIGGSPNLKTQLPSRRDRAAALNKPPKSSKNLNGSRSSSEKEYSHNHNNSSNSQRKTRKYREDPYEKDTFAPAKNKAELLACLTGCMEESAHKLDKARAHAVPLAKKAGTATKHVAKIAAKKTAKVTKKTAKATVKASKTVAKKIDNVKDKMATQAKDDASIESSLYYDDVDADIGGSNQHDRFNISTMDGNGACEDDANSLIEMGLTEADGFRRNITESERSTQTNRFDVSSIDYEEEPSGLGPQLPGLKEAANFRYAPELEDVEEGNQTKCSKSIASGQTNEQDPKKKSFNTYDPGKELEAMKKTLKQETIQKNSAPSSQESKQDLQADFSTEIALHNEDDFFNRLSFSKSTDDSLSAFGAEFANDTSNFKSINPHYVSSPEDNGSTTMDSPVASLFSKKAIEETNKLDAPKTKDPMNPKEKSADRAFSQKPPKQKKQSADSFQKSSVQPLKKTSEYALDNSWLSLTPPNAFSDAKKSKSTKSRKGESIAKVASNKTEIFRILPSEEAPEIYLSSKSAEEAGQITDNSSENSLNIHLTESAPSVLETNLNGSEAAASPAKEDKPSKSATKKRTTQDITKDSSRPPARQTLIKQRSSKSKSPEVIPSAKVQAYLDADREEVSEEEEEEGDLPSLRVNWAETERANSSSLCTSLDKSSSRESDLSTEVSWLKDGPRSKKVGKAPWEDSLLELSTDTSTSTSLVSDQALSNAAFLFSPSYVEDKPHLVKSKSPAREVSLSISTANSRKRLASLPSRSQPNFSIPASQSEDSAPSKVEENNADDATQTSTSTKNTQVRFSDANDIKIISNNRQPNLLAGTPNEVITQGIETKLSDLTEASSMVKSSSPRTSAETFESGASAISMNSVLSRTAALRAQIEKNKPPSKKKEKKTTPKFVRQRRERERQEREQQERERQEQEREDREKERLHEEAKEKEQPPEEEFTKEFPELEENFEPSINLTNEPSILKDQETSGWTYVQNGEGNLSHVTPAKGSVAIKGASPMRRFHAARNMFSPSDGGQSHRPPLAKARSIETTASSKVTEIDGRLKASRPLTLKNPRRETTGDGVIAPRKPKLVDPMFARRDQVVEEEKPKQESIVDDASSDRSSFFLDLRGPDVSTFIEPQPVESSEDTSDDESEMDAFAGIRSKPSVDGSEAPSVATLLQAWKNKENDTRPPKYSSKAAVNPQSMKSHHKNAAAPANLCLSPRQRTPLQARKWRSLAAEANTKETSKQGKKSRNVFRERNMNVH